MMFCVFQSMKYTGLWYCFCFYLFVCFFFFRFIVKTKLNSYLFPQKFLGVNIWVEELWPRTSVRLQICQYLARWDPPLPRGNKLFSGQLLLLDMPWYIFNRALSISYYYYVDSVTNGYVVMMLQQISLDIYTVQWLSSTICNLNAQ